MYLLLLFGAYMPYTVAAGLNYPHGVGVGDINGDGLPDVLVSDTYGSQVYWYENNGNWGFTRHFVGSSSYPLYVDAGDIDSDGDVDIVTGDYLGSNIYVFYNSGNGSSFTSRVLPTSGEAWEVDLGDVDADGDLDIATSTGGGVLLFRNDAGLFTQVYVGSLSWPHGCRFFDMEGDGHLEIASTHPFQVFKNDGAENFSLYYQDANLQEGWGVGPADINGDGYMDVAVNDYYGGATYVYWGSASGFTKQPIGLAGESEGMDMGEINAQTGVDIAVGAASSWVICYYYNPPGFTVEIVDNLYDADLVVICDLNGDMCPDLVASGPMGGAVLAYENRNCPFEVSEGDGKGEPQLRILYAEQGPLAFLAECSGELEIYDATGRLARAYPIGGSNQRISLSGLEPGVYAARVKGVGAQVFVVGK
ncbi:MAG: FG-GAP-like repeat-containing protein [candidate division WOR-3 bacterium]